MVRIRYARTAYRIHLFFFLFPCAIKTRRVVLLEIVLSYLRKTLRRPIITRRRTHLIYILYCIFYFGDSQTFRCGRPLDQRILDFIDFYFLFFFQYAHVPTLRALFNLDITMYYLKYTQPVIRKHARFVRKSYNVLNKIVTTPIRLLFRDPPLPPPQVGNHWHSSYIIIV